jgi:hypothetical protein
MGKREGRDKKSEGGGGNHGVKNYKVNDMFWRNDKKAAEAI